MSRALPNERPRVDAAARAQFVRPGGPNTARFVDRRGGVARPSVEREDTSWGWPEVEPQVSLTLIGAAGTFSGAVIGVVGSLATQRLSHRGEDKRERRETRRKAYEEVQVTLDRFVRYSFNYLNMLEGGASTEEATRHLIILAESAEPTEASHAISLSFEQMLAALVIADIYASRKARGAISNTLNLVTNWAEAVISAESATEAETLIAAADQITQAMRDLRAIMAKELGFD